MAHILNIGYIYFVAISTCFGEYAPFGNNNKSCSFKIQLFLHVRPPVYSLVNVLDDLVNHRHLTLYQYTVSGKKKQRVKSKEKVSNVKIGKMFRKSGLSVS